jgi:transaldolase
MTKLQLLHGEHCQSPWLDNLTRSQLRNGELASLVGHGIRGITSNPTIFATAITGSQDYDDQIRALAWAGAHPTEIYWEVVLTDIDDAAFEDRGRVARGIDDWTDDAFRTLEELAAVGIDFHDVSARLEHAGIVAFAHSFEHLLAIE